MKSKKLTRTAGVRFGSILESFTDAQLKWIGAACMAFNEAEDLVHRVFGACIDYPGRSTVISSRIGIGTLPAIIAEALPKIGVDTSIIEVIERTLMGSGFTQLKTWRDGVVHARLMDMSSGIATVPDKGNPSYVLLSEAALEGLFMRLAIIKDELEEIETIVACARRLSAGRMQDDQHKLKLDRSIQAAKDHCIKHQKRRQSLPPLPIFPDQPDILTLTPHKREDPRKS